MKLYVPLPSCFKFKRMFDENEYLQEVLEEGRDSISLWYINEECDMAELKHLLNKNNIKYSTSNE